MAIKSIIKFVRIRDWHRERAPSGTFEQNARSLKLFLFAFLSSLDHWHHFCFSLKSWMYVAWQGFSGVAERCWTFCFKTWRSWRSSKPDLLDWLWSWSSYPDGCWIIKSTEYFQEIGGHIPVSLAMVIRFGMSGADTPFGTRASSDCLSFLLSLHMWLTTKNKAVARRITTPRPP